MGSEKDIIIAVELASTAIRAIAGKREPDGSMQVLAFAQEEASNTIRKGIIDNIDKTTQALTRVISKLNDKLGVRVNSIYVGLGGQSLRSVHNRVLLQFDGLELLSHKTIDKMRDTNSGVVYPNAEIKEVVPQEFTIGSRSVVDPVGMQAEMLEANFINIVARPTLEENIRKCVAGAGLEVQEIFISPICEGNALLTANEKRSGCALVDIGADTTTVSVYVNNILRHLCVIPLGGSNVTSDITSLKVEAEEAEELKKKYGTAYRSDSEDKTGQKINLSFDRTEDEEKLQEIVEARYEEIIANVCHRISAYKDKMLSGIIVTGGAARIPELAKAFSRQTGGDLNVRIVKGLPENVTISFGVQVGEPDRLYTLYGLLLSGKENCVGEATKSPAQDLFDFGEKDPEEPKEEPKKPEAQDNPEPLESPDKQKKQSAISRVWNKFVDLLSDDTEGSEENV